MNLLINIKNTSGSVYLKGIKVNFIKIRTYPIVSLDSKFALIEDIIFLNNTLLE